VLVHDEELIRVTDEMSDIRSGRTAAALLRRRGE
jgi:hypothetical protein